MTTRDHTVFMTKGTYVVAAGDAERIREALRNDETDVTVRVDAVGDGTPALAMTLVVRHVVALMEHRGELDEAGGESPLRNVAPLRQRRSH